MAIDVTNLTSGADSTDQSTPYTTASISPDRNTALFVAWCSAHGTTAPAMAVSGLGLSWSTVGTPVAFSGGLRMVGLAWAVVGDDPAADVVTLTPDSACTGVCWVVDQDAGGDQVSPIGVDPSYGQNIGTATGTGVTSLTIPSVGNLRDPVAATSRNYTVVATTNASTGTIAPDAFAHTELAEVHGSTPGIGLETSWKSGGFDITIGPSFTGSTDAGGIGVELAAGDLADVQTDVVNAVLDIASRIEVAYEREATRWIEVSAGAVAVVSALAKALINNGALTQAQLDEALAGAQATDYPPIT